MMKTKLILLCIALVLSIKINAQDHNEHLTGMEIYLFKKVCHNEQSYLQLHKKDAKRFSKKHKTTGDIPLNLCKNYINLEHCEIDDQPFLSHADIESFNWNEKTINLTKSGLAKMTQLKIPITGTPFVIKANNQVFYSAWFWNSVSSEGCDRVYCMVNPNSKALKLNFGIGSYKCGKDPRNDTALLEALKK